MIRLEIKVDWNELHKSITEYWTNMAERNEMNEWMKERKKKKRKKGGRKGRLDKERMNENKKIEEK